MQKKKVIMCLDGRLFSEHLQKARLWAWCLSQAPKRKENIFLWKWKTKEILAYTLYYSELPHINDSK